MFDISIDFFGFDFYWEYRVFKFRNHPSIVVPFTLLGLMKIFGGDLWYREDEAEGYDIYI